MFHRYIQAATSPKDIIIMVDISGSMKGLKMTIAKHTINTILDTLGENDFVNVIAVRCTFNKSPYSQTQCYFASDCLDVLTELHLFSLFILHPVSLGCNISVTSPQFISGGSSGIFLLNMVKFNFENCVAEPTIEHVIDCRKGDLFGITDYEIPLLKSLLKKDLKSVI